MRNLVLIILPVLLIGCASQERPNITFSEESHKAFVQQAFHDAVPREQEINWYRPAIDASRLQRVDVELSVEPSGRVSHVSYSGGDAYSQRAAELIVNRLEPLPRHSSSEAIRYTVPIQPAN